MEGIERGKFIILCLILCSFLTVSPVWATTGDVSIGSPATDPAPGDTFEVPVTVDAGINPFGAYNFTVTYDASVVNVQGISGGTAAEFSADPFANPATFSSGATPFNAFNSTSMTLPTGVVSGQYHLQGCGES